MIWCQQCHEIRPIWIDDMKPGIDVTGRFKAARDLMCGHCDLVIATTYQVRSAEEQARDAA